ncbi:MAG TPA: alcohol dehydrogenase catalytic domain-containing protein [Solirubrobacteraceae bacterium]
MRIRAALLEEFGRPLVVQELDLAGPAPGEALVRLVACGVCHTDMYTASGADPSGYAPTVLGHEGAGVVEAVGEGVRDVAVGDHVVTLFSPQCRECIHCRSPRTNLCLDSRAAEPGPPPRRHHATVARRRADPPLHGHLDVCRACRAARDRARQDRP